MIEILLNYRQGQDILQPTCSHLRIKADSVPHSWLKVFAQYCTPCMTQINKLLSAVLYRHSATGKVIVGSWNSLLQVKLTPTQLHQGVMFLFLIPPSIYHTFVFLQPLGFQIHPLPLASDHEQHFLTVTSVMFYFLSMLDDSCHCTAQQALAWHRCHFK